MRRYRIELFFLEDELMRCLRSLAGGEVWCRLCFVGLVLGLW